MKFTIVLFVLLFSGLILAGDVGNTGTGKPGETRSDGENQLLQLRNKEGARVIFSAATVGGHKNIKPFHKDTTLIYRTVMTNIGNAYSPSTGIFTAPFAGVYYFTIFFHTGRGHEAKLLLYKNNEHVLTTHNQPSSYTADNGGNAAFLMLQHGDQMYVRMGENTPAWGSDYHTIFSGFSVKMFPPK
ncbi:complement C1q-like protein 3 [Sebastes umbrosus]|uniref:complement C1q-like protein 3 n=1 Tax=Sebastes umbrosus TaxID=72105 RepID=UPI0018A0CB3D|nr:complement C1q-like protein 3 [Sebastes umbrosus]